jgi:hypothetical protein
MAEAGEPRLGIDVTIKLPCKCLNSANSCWRFNVPRNNQQKETKDNGLIPDREVWFAIRYLDPESDHRECDIAAAVACLAVVCIVCMVCVLLHLRGL